MKEPKLNEEELIGLSEEEKQQKIAELEQRKKEYWEERYRRGKKNIGKNATVATSMNLEIMTARKIQR